MWITRSNGQMILKIEGLHFRLILLFIWSTHSDGHPPTRRLHEDLLSDYNRLIRPVNNHSNKLIVNLGLKLTQLIDLNLKQQVMSTNVWVEQSWFDYKLVWEPKDYGGVDMIHVPAENIWQPDIVLFNNADGNYEVTLMTKALVYHDGNVVWKPPAMYKSTCEIDVEWFPFDVQSCLLKFGSWTYDGLEVDLKHVEQTSGSKLVQIGIDMSEFYKSVEWDILLVPAKYNEEFFECCPGVNFPDITFNMTMRRKTLFYTVNLIIPCVGITFLTILVFYLPSDSGEKVTLAISILVCLTVFFLLLAEIIPPTSLAVPLIGKYLLFTMILVTLSISITVGVLNVHFRSPSTHKMAPWVKTLFIHMLPRLLLMKRPSFNDLAEELALASGPAKIPARACNGGSNDIAFRANAPSRNGYRSFRSAFDEDIPGLPIPSMVGAAGSDIEHKMGIMPPFIPNAIHASMNRINWTNTKQSGDQQVPGPYQYSPEVQKAIESILFIAEHIRKEDKDNNVIEDWKYVAMVLDRLFLWIFTIACVVGTCGILLQAPSLYDQRVPIDSQLSQIGR